MALHSTIFPQSSGDTQNFRDKTQWFNDFAQFTRQNARRMQAHYRQFKQEHPVRLLAIMSGIAFLAGAIYRIRRSR